MRATLAVVLATAALLGACSSEEETSAPPPQPDGAARFVGNDKVQWEHSEHTAVAVDGQLDVTLVCDGVVPHDLVIDAVNDGAEVAACAGNDEASATITIDPGTYEFHCAIPGHREAGMVGTLTVE